MTRTPEQIMQGILWHYRHTQPSLSVTIKEAEEAAFKEACAFQNIDPVITIAERPAINKDGITKPAYFVVAITDKDGNAITPMENNEKDFLLAEKARNKERLAAGAKDLASKVRNNANTGDFSSSAIIELCDTVQALL